MNMIEMWENNKIWVISMLCIALAGGFARMLAYSSRKRLCNQSAKMDQSKHKKLNKMKQEYEMKRNKGLEIHNFNAFIEKYLMNVKCGPFQVSFLENANLISFVLCVLIGMIGAAISYNQQKGMDEIVNLFLVALVLGGCMVLCEGCLQGEILRERTKCYIEDYFQNKYQYIQEKKKEFKEVKNTHKELAKEQTEKKKKPLAKKNEKSVSVKAIEQAAALKEKNW